jgi:DNA-binding response OmpR family regulator
MHRIVLVEDSPTQALKLQALLQGEGFAVDCCATGEDGLRAIGQQVADLIVVDYHLPGMRGDELCRRIRLDIGARQLPILMFTEDETHASELRALDAGADDYIAKSVETRTLIARIRGLLRKGQVSQAILGPAQPHLREVWMLTVDDSPTYLEKISLELERDGYRCDRASSGEECLERLATRRYDCVVLDLVMPGMDGIEVCRHISEMRRNMRHPLSVLMLTAQDSQEDLARALEAGADDFVGKSNELPVLKGRIRALLRRNLYLEENRRILEELKAQEMETVRERIEKQAAEARAALAQQLEVANRELEAFSYSVSHDLRAPLRIVDGYSRILLEDHAASLDAQGQAHLQLIRQSCQQMGQLIDDLLNLSRVIQHEIQVERTDLAAIAREIVDRLRGGDPERRVGFRVPDQLLAEGDPGLLRAALENLLANAWKFTRKQAEAVIELGSREQDGQTVYFVKDNGAGFDMRYASKLFGAFQRLHAAADFPGTGIGLATVQRIVHRHQGRIWAEGAVGAGATFHFTLGLRS